MLTQMPRRVILGILCCALLAGCKKQSVPSTTPPPVTGNQITGRERLGFDQRALDAAELATFRYGIAVDGVSSELLGVTCDSSPSSQGFACTAPLPPLTAGPHVLVIAAVLAIGELVLVSPVSPALNVTVVPSAATAGTPESPIPPGGIGLTTADGIALRLDQIADGLDYPTDLAFAPDGRLFIAEAAGRILTLDAGGHVAPAAQVISEPLPGSRLLAIALDPRFDETHFLYALWSEPVRNGEPSFTLARFTESRGVLYDRAVLMDGVAAAVDPHGMVRFGPDGKLYVAFDDANDTARVADLASRNGKVLRINADGTTPDDQDKLTPVFAYGFRTPHALDWQPSTRELWVADANETGRSLLYALRPIVAPRNRGVFRAAFTLPQPTTGTAAAFYRGKTIPAFENNLLVASEEAQHLLRVRFDPADPARIASTERLLQGVVGGLRVVAEAPDGAIIIGTATTLSRIAPPH